MGLESTLSWTAVVAAVTWLATRLYDWVKDHRSEIQERERFLLALHAEIDINVRDFKELSESAPPISAIRSRMEKDNSFAPYITFTRVDGIFKSRLAFIHHAGSGFIAEMMSFYADLDHIESEVMGIYTAAFQKISLEGRLSSIEDIYAIADRCVVQGSRLLDQIEDLLPGVKTKRLSADTQNGAENHDLDARYRKFELDLNLARTAGYGLWNG